MAEWIEPGLAGGRFSAAALDGVAGETPSFGPVAGCRRPVGGTFARGGDRVARPARGRGPTRSGDDRRSDHPTKGVRTRHRCHRSRPDGALRPALYRLVKDFDHPAFIVGSLVRNTALRASPPCPTKWGWFHVGLGAECPEVWVSTHRKQGGSDDQRSGADTRCRYAGRIATRRVGGRGGGRTATLDDRVGRPAAALQGLVDDADAPP